MTIFNFKFTRDTLFYNYTTLMFIYIVANGLLFPAKSLLSILIPTVFVIYSLWINVNYNKYYKNTMSMYIFMLYILVLMFFSSELLYSLKNVLKFFLSFLYFGVAVVFVKNYDDLFRLFKAMMTLGFLFIVNILISNLFNLGGGAYGNYETSYLQTGSVYSEGLNAMGYYLVMLPAIIQLYPFRRKKNIRTIIISSVIILIFLILILKRGSLLAVVVGYFVLLIFSEIKQKNQIIKIIVFSSILLTVTYPIYKNMLMDRIKVREARFRLDSYETEGRFTENELVIEDIFYSGNISWLLFGHEVLNSSYNYGGGIYGERQLHNDYAQILSGSGIIGMSLYLLLNISILNYFLKLRRRLIRLGLYTKREKTLNMLFWTYFIVYFALGVSGSIGSLLYAPIRFIILGSIIGLFNSIPIQHKMRISNI